MSTDTPDLTAILDDLYIGNLASAKTLHDHPELGITHVLSVCPDYPESSVAREGASDSDDASCSTTNLLAHRCVPIEDSEYEDILVHLPSAIAFIKDALVPSQASSPQGTVSGKTEGQQTVEMWGGKEGSDSRAREAPYAASFPKHKVLVHCVMGVSRSTTVVCAYLMATRQLSFPAALMFIRKRRPRVHPNYGFRRQLQIFEDCDYFSKYPAPIQTHPAYTTWQRRKRREVTRYLARLDDIVEIKLDDEKPTISFTDNFPTDQQEASSLLSEVGATHFLTISPVSLPSSFMPPHLAVSQSRRPSGLITPILSPSSSSASPPDSITPSPLSSRSSSFSNGFRLSSPVSGSSTPATSIFSLPSLLAPSKLRLEVSSSDSDEESENEFCGEPDYLALAGVQHHHIVVNESDPSSLLLHLSDSVRFIQHALCDHGSESDQDLNPNETSSERRRHVLIYSATESRTCAVACAYFMSCKGLSPSQAYALIEKAQPLFNPTRSFVTLLELFHDCDYNPTLDHPLVRSWLSGPKPASPSSSSTSSAIFSSKAINPRVTTHWKVESDTEGDLEPVSLRRKLGTPMRCGSFSNAYMQQRDGDSNNKASQKQAGSDLANTSASGSEGASGLNVEAMLQRFEGVGDPNFAFDVEAFRGALRGIAAGSEKKTARVADA